MCRGAKCKKGTSTIPPDRITAIQRPRRPGRLKTTHGPPFGLFLALSWPGDPEAAGCSPGLQRLCRLLHPLRLTERTAARHVGPWQASKSGEIRAFREHRRPPTAARAVPGMVEIIARRAAAGKQIRLRKSGIASSCQKSKTGRMPTGHCPPAALFPTGIRECLLLHFQDR